MFADCQSGFIPGNSCISQLLSISQEIHKSFECNPLEVVRGAFLDISKVFNRVCLEGLIFKFKHGVEGKLIKLLEIYLKNQNQRVVPTGLSSSWKKLLAVVPQRSLLGLVLFLMYINDLPHDLPSICKMFADDISLFFKSKRFSLILTMTEKQ